MGKLKAIILAAGEGTRMKSQMPKVLHEILGKPMLYYVANAAKEAGVDEVIVVVGKGAQEIEQKMEGLKFVTQYERLGTGHAAMCAKEYIEEDDRVIILYGDTPLVKGEEIRAIFDRHINNGADATVVSAILPDPTGYGRIIRNNGVFEKIAEHRDADDEQRLIREVNTGLYCFNGDSLKFAFTKLTTNNVQNEYYLTDALEIIKREGLKADIFVSDSPEDYFGINDRVQLHEAARLMQTRINRSFMRNGVTIMNAETVYISSDVKIGQDTIILPGTILEGDTAIGENCEIGPYTRITNMEIGSNCHIQNSVLVSSKIGNHVNIGPFAYIRPNTVLMDNVKIGDFVEVKNSVVGEGSKASHLAYIGDADIGSGVNFGCGAITVNYDGKNKGRTVVSDKAFVGSNSNLVAPVQVGEEAYIAAGSTVTKDVPANSLTFGRAKQVNLENRAKKL